MKVKELIQYLKKKKPAEKVFIFNGEFSEYNELLFEEITTRTELEKDCWGKYHKK